MSQMTMTLIGLYNYDNSIFDNWELPESINKDALTYLLLQRYGEFEPIFTSTEFLKESVGMWSKAHIYTLDKWVKGFDADFNPIENYDRYEDINDVGHNSSESSNKGNNLNKTSGYDSEELVNADSSESSNAFNNAGEYNNTHKAHIHGNIGVTTSVKMLEEFTQFYKNNNIYSMICDLFADEYLIRLY